MLIDGKIFQTLYIYFFILLFFLFLGGPSCGSDLDREMGWGEEGKNLGGDVVPSVVHALAE